MGVVNQMPAREWSYVIDFPDDGWIWAPEPDAEIATWAQDVCADMYAEGDQETELADQLRAYALSYRDGGYEAGALWIPDVQYGVLAVLAAERLVGDGDHPLSLDTVQRLEEGMIEPGLAAAEVTRVELPAGPAVRARRIERVGGLFGTERVAELVSHVIIPGDLQTPAGEPAGVRLIVSWQLLTHGDDLAQLADDCAGLLRIERG